MFSFNFIKLKNSFQIDYVIIIMIIIYCIKSNLFKISTNPIEFYVNKSLVPLVFIHIYLGVFGKFPVAFYRCIFIRLGLRITLATADQALVWCLNVQWVHFEVLKRRILKFMALTASGLWSRFHLIEGKEITRGVGTSWVMEWWYDYARPYYVWMDVSTGKCKLILT